MLLLELCHVLPYLDCFSEGIKEAFRYRAARAKLLAQRIEGLSKDAQQFGMSTNFETQAQSLRNYGNNLGKFLRQHGRADHDQAIPIIVSSILTYKPDFNEWKALASVIQSAYAYAGRDTKADFEKLLRRAAATQHTRAVQLMTQR